MGLASAILHFEHRVQKAGFGSGCSVGLRFGVGVGMQRCTQLHPDFQTASKPGDEAGPSNDPWRMERLPKSNIRHRAEGAPPGKRLPVVALEPSATQASYIKAALFFPRSGMCTSSNVKCLQFKSGGTVEEIPKIKPRFQETKVWRAALRICGVGHHQQPQLQNPSQSLQEGHSSRGSRGVATATQLGLLFRD